MIDAGEHDRPPFPLPHHTAPSAAGAGSGLPGPNVFSLSPFCLRSKNSCGVLKSSRGGRNEEDRDGEEDAQELPDDEQSTEKNAYLTL